jgi:hypothetical protein
MVPLEAILADAFPSGALGEHECPEPRREVLVDRVVAEQSPVHEGPITMSIVTSMSVSAGSSPRSIARVRIVRNGARRTRM